MNLSKNKITKDLSVIKKTDFIFSDIPLSHFSKKLKHSMLSSSNKTFYTYDKTKLKEILQCNTKLKKNKITGLYN